MDTQATSVDSASLSNVMDSVGSQLFLNVKKLVAGDPLRKATFNALGLGCHIGREGSGNARGMANCKGGARLDLGKDGSTSRIVRYLRQQSGEFRAQGKDYRLH